MNVVMGTIALIIIFQLILLGLPQAIDKYLRH